MDCWVPAEILRSRTSPMHACIDLLYAMDQHWYDRRTMPSTCLYLGHVEAQSKITEGSLVAIVSVFCSSVVAKPR